MLVGFADGNGRMCKALWLQASATPKVTAQFQWRRQWRGIGTQPCCTSTAGEMQSRRP